MLISTLLVFIVLLSKIILVLFHNIIGPLNLEIAQENANHLKQFFGNLGYLDHFRSKSFFIVINLFIIELKLYTFIIVSNQ